MRQRRSRAVAAVVSVVALVMGLTAVVAESIRTADAATAPTVRHATEWPFAWNSIWNMPRGTSGELVPAGITAATGWGMTVDEDILVLEPDAPQTNLVRSTAGWDWNQTRCGSVESNNVLAGGLPIPTDFTTEPGYLGRTPNHPAAILMADGSTVLQTQPFHRCGAGGAATSQYMFPSVDLRTSDGIAGAHGGSAMSSIGGTVRLGELVPGGTIRHAVKLNINCAALCYYAANEADGKAGYRWPALAADSGAQFSYGGTNPHVQMGSLLALDTGFDESTLRTEPARILARAMRDYGGYIVDNTGWDVYALATEWSPDGRVIDEFEQRWGYSINAAPTDGCTDTGDPSCQFAQDMADLFTSLGVVTDNAPSTIGGAGARLAPCAPPFADGSGGAPAGCGAPSDTTPTSPPTTIPGAADVLKVSVSANRDTAAQLDGAHFGATDDVYVFLEPVDVVLSRVEFWLDDPNRTGSPRQIEGMAPYDFAGGSVATANAFSLRGLAPGDHVITARRTTSAGVSTVVSSTFTVGVSNTTSESTTTTTSATTTTTSETTTTTSETTTTTTTTTPPTIATTTTTTAAPTATTEPPAPTGDVLRVSANANRSSANALNGAQLGASGAVYVFLEPTDTALSRVEFWLDDHNRTGPPRQIEGLAPYDFAGGSMANANPLLLSGLATGSHVITARRTTSTGAATVVSATFTIGVPPTGTTGTTGSTTTTTTTSASTTQPPTSSTTTTAAPTTTTPPTAGYALRVSAAANRSAAVALHGASLPRTGNAYVFLVTPAPVLRVQFWLDDPARRGPAHQTELAAPYDFAGGSVATATGWALANVAGTHTVTAVAFLANGTQVVTSATFTAA